MNGHDVKGRKEKVLGLGVGGRYRSSQNNHLIFNFYDERQAENRTEGIIPAPESNHAVCACIEEAPHCKERGEAKTLLFNLSGHGHFDMAAYDKYFGGQLEDSYYPESEIHAALERLPKVA